jgi:hypothetical protein
MAAAMTSKREDLRRLCDMSLLPLLLSLKRYLSIYGIIIIVATGIMTPRLRAPNFGLLDDGVTIAVASSILQELKAGNWGAILRLEAERGRFRPFYWLYYAIPYYISGPSASGFFVAQWLSLVLTAIVIFSAVEVVTKDPVAGILSSTFYMLSPPVIESYYTLSKPEPPLVLWIVLSLYLLWRSSEIRISERTRGRVLIAVSTLFLTIAYLTKETALAVLLISALWTLRWFFLTRISQDHRPFEARYEYFIVNVLLSFICWGARILSGTSGVSSGAESRQYRFVLEALYNSLFRHISWYIRDFLYLLPIIVFLTWLMLKAQKNRDSSKNLGIFDASIWIAGWTAIMLPWHSTLEYYLLPATIGSSMIAGIGVSEIIKHFRDLSNIVRTLACAVLLSVLFSGSIGLANGFTNGRIQIATDSVNTDLIDYLASNIPINGIIFINLPEPNEYMLEIGLHLAVFKQRPDILVHYFDSLNVWSDLGAFIVTPIMQNQPHPSVRIAVQEQGAKISNYELHKKVSDAAAPVYERVETVALFTVAVETVICPLLMYAHARDVVHCGVDRPLIDRRVFRYGWKVYRI